MGYKAKDKVTGANGVITSISFDLFGCIQVVVTPPLGKDGKLAESIWFDIGRLEITSKKPVMDVPDFVNGPVSEGKKGAAEKPAF